jgi:hypothetical protein
MKKHISTLLAVAAGGVWLALGASNTFAQSIGVSFVSNGSSSGIDNAETDSMLPADLAGAPPYAQTNWNNFGRYGSIDPVVLTNSVGGAEAFNLQWDSGGADTTGAGAGLGTPDGKLMDGFIYSYSPGPATTLADSVYNCSINNKPLVYVGGLNAWYTSEGAEAYTVVLYTTGYSYYETAEGWIQSVSGNPSANTMAGGPDLTAHVFAQDTSVFTGTYVPATGSSSAVPTSGANYMVFRGLTNDAVLLRLQSDGYGSGLNGFQFVPIYPSAPTAVTPTVAPDATVFAGVPVTLTEAAIGDPIHPALYYQWQSDNASGGGVTNDILNATNATYSFTPTNNTSTYTINFQVIVTNSFGSSTSSIVSLTVNPASAPYLTQDTIPGAGNGAAEVYAYANGTVSFSAAFDGTRPITNQWQFSSGGSYVNVAQATNTTLTLADVQPSADGNYQLLASNPVGSLNSTPSTLVVLPDPAAPRSITAYPYDVFTNNPVAYWRFSETGDNVGSSLQAYDSSGHNFDATYGNGAIDNQQGPQSPAFAGFETTNTAVTLNNGVANSFLTAPSLNLNTNTVTITAWIYPTTGEPAYTGLFTWTNGTDKAGFGFGSTLNSGMAELGYTWNTNSPATYGFHSGLFAPEDEWSFVALTITPTNATIYLYNTDGVSVTNLAKAVNPLANIPEAFGGGTTWIGSDTTASRNFSGTLDEVAVFGTSLSEAQVQDLFLKAIGAAGIPPTVASTTASPSVPVYSGQNVLLSASASGTVPLSLQWQSSPDGVTWANVPGATAATYVANPLTVGTIYYQLVATNPAGSGTNAPVVVTFNALPASPAGLWTANFEVTNDVLDYATSASSGTGHYVGRGILGAGMYWNILSETAGAFGYEASLSSVSDLRDDGATHAGVYMSILASEGFSSATAALTSSNDIGNLVYQYTTVETPADALQFQGLPDGTYNLVVYGIDGIFDDRGITVTVHDALNGDQTNSTENDLGPAVPLAQGVNFVLFTHVHASGGTLLADIAGNANIASHPGNTEADMNGAQLQLVSYDVPAPIVTVSGDYAGANRNLALSWPEGILQTATNLAGPWTPVYAPSPITMTTTNRAQFYRVEVHP